MTVQEQRTQTSIPTSLVVHHLNIRDSRLFILLSVVFEKMSLVLPVVPVRMKGIASLYGMVSYLIVVFKVVV